jgi:aminoglycoside 3-N-acetyltransferase
VASVADLRRGAASAQIQPLTKAEITASLRDLGVRDGQSLLVHASMRSLGWVDGGSLSVVGALREAVGRTGNIVVPTGTEENSTTSRAHLARISGLTSEQVAEYRSRMPAFDARYTPATGVVAEQVRKTPGAHRSEHPQSSYAAVGPQARELMADHQLSCHHGEQSPLAKLYDADAAILMLGVGYRACTALHLAEYRYTSQPPLRNYFCVITEGGRPRWTEYEDVVLDDEPFEEIGDCLDERDVVTQAYLGQAASRLVPMRHAVDFAAEWLARHRGSGLWRYSLVAFPNTGASPILVVQPVVGMSAARWGGERSACRASA